jgi:hypothetical protein
LGAKNNQEERGGASAQRRPRGGRAQVGARPGGARPTGGEQEEWGGAGVQAGGAGRGWTWAAHGRAVWSKPVGASRRSEEGLELGKSSRTGAARCEEEEARVSR